MGQRVHSGAAAVQVSLGLDARRRYAQPANVSPLFPQCYHHCTKSQSPAGSKHTELPMLLCALSSRPTSPYVGALTVRCGRRAAYESISFDALRRSMPHRRECVVLRWCMLNGRCMCVCCMAGVCCMLHGRCMCVSLAWQVYVCILHDWSVLYVCCRFVGSAS